MEPELGLVASTVPKFVDDLQSGGRYTFRRDEALSATRASRAATKAALQRLAAKGRVVAPKRGFYVIVPLEYRAAGCPPASWFVDDLMAFLRRPYYVGLLTASSLHGAAHHAPQEFQIVTTAQIRPVEVGRVRIRFFTKRRMADTPIVQVKTETGSMRVSGPEVTAIDLMRYTSAAGALGNVATVLSELGERLEPAKLLDAADRDAEVPSVQRLGFLLELVGQGGALLPLEKWLAVRQTRPTPLNPKLPVEGKPVNRRWQVVVNDEVEAEA